MSMIDKAMNDLREAILVEMNEASNKHRDALTTLANLQKTVLTAAEILHNVPRLGDLEGAYDTTKVKLKKIDEEIEKAWDLLDKSRAGSTA